MVHIRLAQLIDASPLAELVTIFSGFSTSSEQITFRMNAMKDSETVYVADEESQIIGFVSLRLVHFFSGDNLYAEVTDLFVHPDFRRKKVAQELMNHVSSICSDKGVSELVLITGFDNVPAQSFYKNIGYKDWALAMKKLL